MENKRMLDELEDKVIQLFQKVYDLYSNSMEFAYVRKIASQIESEISVNSDFFNKEGEDSRSKKIDRLVSSMTSGNDSVYEFIRYEYASPFGLFSTIFNEEEIPDIAISNQLVKVQLSSTVFRNIYVPDEVKEGFAYFLEHLVNKLKFMDEKKLNMAEAILDSSFEEFRFNIIHNSLNSFDGPVVTVRKHTQQGTQENSKQMNIENYEESLGVSLKGIEILKEYSGKSMCIFGEPGSGKTTLLRYLASHKLEEKRNLCVIEDTAELGLPVNISLVTNKSYTIRNLFTAALRQNPSHMIIGETRNDEIVDIMESGLTFSVGTTIHANSFSKALERIYFMSRPRGLSKEDIHDLTSASIEMFVHMEQRKIKGIWIKNDKDLGDIFEKYDKLEILKSNIKLEASGY